MIPYSLYIHIPFCTHRCGYCDFNTYAGQEALIPEYTEAIYREVEFISREMDIRLPVHTIFFGGGTPSLLSIKELEVIITSLDKYFDLSPDLEVSLEANPGTVSIEYLKELFILGVNRLSIGMQSANIEELSLLERQHTFTEVKLAVEWARIAGFNNLNLDLIFGLPYQTSNTWMYSLEQALALTPNHLSLYALTLEHGTPMQSKVDFGLLPEPDPDVAAEMYELASDRLLEAGFIQYEISNWARVNDQGVLLSCKHNLQYWRNLPYLGVGAGAHGYANCYRTENILTPRAYIRVLNYDTGLTKERNSFPHTPATAQMLPIDEETEIGETMMMGLRLIHEGVSNSVFQNRFGKSITQLFNTPIVRLESSGLLEWAGEEGDILRLTQKGRLLGNQVFKEFI
jgi:putative oxygen-independent coproporphyrinogen III oxidase